jgi:hypothetical protein
VGDRGADELERRVEDAMQSVRMIESRVTAELDSRLDALEALSEGGALAAAPAPAVGPPSADASAWDVSTVLDRLYALEMRQEKDGLAREASERAGSARLDGLERRLAQIEGQGDPAPAAPPAR